LILCWVTPKTIKMVSAASLVLTLSAEDKERVGGLYVSESKINSVLAL